MNKLVEALIDIYAQVGDFRISPFDGAIPISEADRLAEKAVEDYTNAALMEVRAQNERLLNLLRDCNTESMSWLDARDAALEEQSK
jgi:hypothetical protein